MPFWPQGPTGREKVYVCVCACVCMLFTGRSSYLLPPHLSGHLPHSARKECLFHCKMAIPSQNDNVIIQRRTRTHTHGDEPFNNSNCYVVAVAAQLTNTCEK